MLFAIVLALTIGCIAFILVREGQGVPGPEGLRGRVRACGWGLLLLPVAMAAAVMAGGAHGLIPAGLGLAVLAIVFARKLAAQGTGLAGVERRLAAFDGILAVNSPPGGPTIVVIEVPCALSSPKTSTC